jgi:hypothetical protein
MSWLLIPPADRAIARAILGRIDEIMGFPRTHLEDEIVRVGPVAQTVPAPRTETQSLVMRHSTVAGLAALRGVIAIDLGAIRGALGERFFVVNSQRRRLREVIVGRNWEVRQGDLPGSGENWLPLPARDGAAGSANGTPIPEGAE